TLLIEKTTCASRTNPEGIPNLPRIYPVPTTYLARSYPEPFGLLSAYHPLVIPLPSACCRRTTIYLAPIFNFHTPNC
ncbi:MAG: hypothetical protein IKX93_07485, partial [Bacteroidaceae bacterium]|nr:hypothetical protein [Bacteroidaceae bacterium]